MISVRDQGVLGDLKDELGWRQAAEGEGRSYIVDQVGLQ